MDSEQQLLVDLLRRHVTTSKPMPDAATDDMHMVQCPACDGNQWKLIRTGDPIPSCDFILRANDLGVRY